MLYIEVMGKILLSWFEDNRMKLILVNITFYCLEMTRRKTTIGNKTVSGSKYEIL